MRRKLCQRRGTTLSEMLVAVAILGLVSLAITVGVSASLRIYRDSVRLSDAQTLASTLTQALLDDLRFARDIRPDAAGGLSYTSPNHGMNAVIGQTEDGRVTINGEELVGSGAYAGLTAAVTELGMEGDTVRFDLEVRSGDEIVQTVTAAVRPLNPQGEAEETAP